MVTKARAALLMAVVCAVALTGWWLVDGRGPGSEVTAARQDAVTGKAPTADERRSLATLRMVDKGHPFFTMTLFGSYDAEKQVRAAPQTAKTPWACSLFLANGPKGPVFGRNFDWEDHPALLLTTGNSLSLVDLAYLGIDKDNASRLTSDPALRRKLLHAVKLPFDGMNKDGLAVGLASVPSAKPPRDPGRSAMGSVRIQRMVLDQARTVNEAIAVFQRYNIEFGSGEPTLHYLVADAAGNSAAIEFVDGRLRVVRDARQMVNFVLTGSSDQEKRADGRYRTITDRMAATGGRLDPGGAMDLLSRVAQSHTRWSAVYELRNAKIHVSLRRDYGKTREFTLPGSRG